MKSRVDESDADSPQDAPAIGVLARPRPGRSRRSTSSSATPSTRIRKRRRRGRGRIPRSARSVLRRQLGRCGAIAGRRWPRPTGRAGSRAEREARGPETRAESRRAGTRLRRGPGECAGAGRRAAADHRRFGDRPWTTLRSRHEDAAASLPTTWQVPRTLPRRDSPTSRRSRRRRVRRTVGRSRRVHGVARGE